MHAKTDHAAVIAGVGLTGLTLAGELALRASTPPRRAAGHQALPGSRSGGLLSRTIEVLDQRGSPTGSFGGTVIPGAAFAGHPAGHQRLPDPPSLRARALAEAHRAHPGRPGSPSSRCRPPRPRGDRLRTGRHRRRRGAVRRPTLRAQYLVGCDGGRSLIRKAAGIEFPGWDPTTSALIAEAEMAEEPPLGIRHDARGAHALGRRHDEIRDGEWCSPIAGRCGSW